VGKPRIAIVAFTNLHPTPEMQGREKRLAANLETQFQQTGNLLYASPTQMVNRLMACVSMPLKSKPGCQTIRSEGERKAE